MLLTEIPDVPEGTPLVYARWILERGVATLFTNRNQPDKFIPVLRAVTLNGLVDDPVEGPMVSVRVILDGETLHVPPQFLHSDVVEAHAYLTKAIHFKLNAIKIA